MLPTQIGSKKGMLTASETELYIRDLHAMGADTVLLSFTEFFYDGEEREQRFAGLKKTVRQLKEAGFRVVVWTTSLGYGDCGSPLFHKMFGDSIKLTSFSGYTTDAVCTMDENFKKYICRNIQDIIKCGVDTILMDDELVQSVRPGFLCTCSAHLAAFEKRTGTKYTRQDIQDLFCGKPSPLRTAYLDLMGDTFKDFCQSLRDAADEVDPSVCIGLCASFTNYDIEGAHMPDIIRILAGKGNKPFYRYTGAPYWAVFSRRYPGQTLEAVCEFVRMQTAWFNPDEAELFDENDCHPRNHRIVPTAYVEQYDKAMIASHIQRHKYVLCFEENSATADRAYLNNHIRNMKHDSVLTDFFNDKTAVGWTIRQPMHCLRDAVLPAEYIGDWPMMARFSQPFGGIFVAENSQPTTYGTDGPVIAFGDCARYLSEDDLKRGIFTDLVGAAILQEKNIDTGYLSYEATTRPQEEQFAWGNEKFIECNGVFYRTELKPTATIHSYFVSGDGNYPAVYSYSDNRGHSIAVLCADFSTLQKGITDNFIALISTSRGLQLASLYKTLSGRDVPVHIEGYPNLYVLASKNDTGAKMSLLIENNCPDTAYEPVLTVDGNYRVNRTLKCTATAQGNTIILDDIRPYDFCAIEIERTDC